MFRGFRGDGRSYDRGLLRRGHYLPGTPDFLLRRRYRAAAQQCACLLQLSDLMIDGCQNL